MYILTIINAVAFFVAAGLSLYRIRSSNPRRGLRIAAFCISVYIMLVYLLGALRIIHNGDFFIGLDLLSSLLMHRI